MNDRPATVNLRRAESGLAERLVPQNSSQVIVVGRLALATFALVAIYIDPTQPTRYSQETYLILAGYVAWSAILAIAGSLSVQNPQGGWLVHAIDVAIYSLLFFLTDGPTSPFVVFFTFAIIAGALRWGWKGAIGTSVFLVILYLSIGYREFADPEGNVNRVIIRSAHLLIAGAMIGYFGAYRTSSRNRLARLASWPRSPEELPGDQPALESCLRHAAFVLGVSRIAAIFKLAPDPEWHAARLTGEGYEIRPLFLAGDSLVATDLETLAFMTADPLGSRVITARGIWNHDAPIVDAGIVSELRIGSLSTAPFVAHRFRGRVFIPAPPGLNAEFLSLTEIVAGRVELELEQYSLRSEIAAAAAARVRTHIARDMHDSILQDLTAARLKLNSIAANTDTPVPNSAIDQAVATLDTQQKRIREFVSSVNPKKIVSRPDLLDAELKILSDSLSAQWRVHVEHRVTPPRARLGNDAMAWLKLVISEAVANAVRHGDASRIDIEVTATDGLGLEITDDGIRGGECRGGATAVMAPHSISQRINELGGTCKLVLSAGGARLSIRIPGL